MPFSDVFGHKPILSWLARQVASGTMSHAYLFLGPEGVGKRFVAQHVAQAMHCESPVKGEGCGRCVRCQLVTRGQHPDVRLVGVPEDKQQIVIEQIRELQHWLALTPFHGGRKIAIIDEADTMQEPAASALLKTLEEPPPTAILILVASHESRLLPTIVSRCTKLHFGPLGTEELRRALEARQIAPDRAQAVARRAAGRLGRAIQLAASPAWERTSQVLQDWAATTEQGHLEPTLAGRPRPEVEEALEAIAAWYHDAVLVQLGADPALLVYPDHLAETRTLATRWSLPQLLEAIEQVYQTRALVQQRVNSRTAIATLIAKLQPMAR